MEDLDNDSSSDEERILFANSPEWADVTPIPQDDGQDPVCPILYSEDFRETMDYFRAIIQADERSERSLKLTQAVIALNPANYTAWHFRRAVLDTIGGDLLKELDFIVAFLPHAQKNYQIWHHRQCIVERLGDPSREKQFIEIALKKDPKNYHAWSYRFWVVQNFDLWEGELEYIDGLIETDVRNNSAWNARYFVITRGGTIHPDDVAKSEIEYTLSKMERIVNNEAVWNYLRPWAYVHVDQEGLFNTVRAIRDRHEPSIYPKCFLIDVFTKAGVHLAEALEMARDLEQKWDKIREKYWSYRVSKIQEMM